MFGSDDILIENRLGKRHDPTSERGSGRKIIEREGRKRREREGGGELKKERRRRGWREEEREKK